MRRRRRTARRVGIGRALQPSHDERPHAAVGQRPVPPLQDGGRRIHHRLHPPVPEALITRRGRLELLAAREVGRTLRRIGQVALVDEAGEPFELTEPERIKTGGAKEVLAEVEEVDRRQRLQHPHVLRQQRSDRRATGHMTRHIAHLRLFHVGLRENRPRILQFVVHLVEPDLHCLVGPDKKLLVRRRNRRLRRLHQREPARQHTLVAAPQNVTLRTVVLYRHCLPLRARFNEAGHLPPSSRISQANPSRGRPR